MKPKTLPPGSPQGQAPRPEQNQSKLMQACSIQVTPPVLSTLGAQKSKTNLCLTNDIENEAKATLKSVAAQLVLSPVL